MKSKFFKKTFVSLVILVVTSVILITSYIYKDRKMVTLEDSLTVSIRSNQANQTISNSKIGLIGDSWVANKDLEKAIENALASLGNDIDIISFGHPGARSKDVLNNLMSNTSSQYSSSPLLVDNEIKYIIILAGVNDTAGHIGSDYYTHHMIEIVRLINSYNKTPIILEIPEYGIEEPQSFKATLKQNLYKILFDGNKTDVIEDYRELLKNELKSLKLVYTLIPFEPTIKEYRDQKSLYSNPFHLNEEGNKVLGTYLGNYIFNKLK